jgi:hypothetical protein
MQREPANQQVESTVIEHWWVSPQSSNVSETASKEPSRTGITDSELL